MYKRIMAMLAYLQIFASMITSTILTFLPGVITYKEFVLVTGVACAIVIFYSFFANKGTVKNIMISILIMGILFAFYSATKSFYSFPSEKYISFYLVIIGQTIPAVATAAIVSVDKDIQYLIKRTTPFVGLVFTIVSVVALFTTSTTSGGYLLTDSGLNYQSNSYLAAYAASMSMYYIFSKDQVCWKRPFNTKLFEKLTYILLLVNFVTILLSGGRGALVLFFVLFICFLYLYYKCREVNSVLIRKSVIYLVLVGIVLVVGVQFAMKSTLEISGFERILITIQEGDQNGRAELRRSAIKVFNNSPIYGHGLGSVFFELGEYSHNIFTDILVETGMIGLFILVILVYTALKKENKLILNDSTDSLWFFIFLDGFIMALFSGYYLAIIPIIWSMSFVFYKRIIINTFLS